LLVADNNHVLEIFRFIADVVFHEKHSGYARRRAAMQTGTLAVARTFSDDRHLALRGRICCRFHSLGYRDSMSREGDSFWDQFRTFRQLKEYAAVGEVKSWKRGAFREFAREHPAEANCLRQSRRAGNFAIATGLAGAVGSGAFAYKYGRSGLGATLAATAGFAAAALMGGHAASVYYWGFSPKVDPLDASILFLKWVKDHEQS